VIPASDDTEWRNPAAGTLLTPRGSAQVLQDVRVHGIEGAREVIVMTPIGDELARWKLESTDERFPNVEVAVDDAGRVYVADDAQKAILVYEPE
jgi:hypothetical protein